MYGSKFLEVVGVLVVLVPLTYLLIHQLLQQVVSSGLMKILVQPTFIMIAQLQVQFGLKLVVLVEAG